jgi:hypothetical protein
MAELQSGEWWGERARCVPPLPPEGVLRDVLRDLLRAVRLPPPFQASPPPRPPPGCSDRRGSS